MEEPFILRAARVGAQAGGEHLGATLYELAHHGDEELLIVLDGQPTVRQPAGARQLAAGDVAAFRRGVDGAHRIENHASEPARMLIASTMIFPDVVEHPDSDKLVTLTGSPFEAVNSSPSAVRTASLRSTARRLRTSRRRASRVPCCATSAAVIRTIRPVVSPESPTFPETALRRRSLPVPARDRPPRRALRSAGSRHERALL